MRIPFNKPYLSGNETEYIKEAVLSGKISGDGVFTRKCHEFFENRYGFKKSLLTTSCTDALEMASILINIAPGDEVIIPSFTFVSSANAFVLRGASIVFADSEANSPNIDVSTLESLITPKTKAIIPVHYAGVACKMDEIMELARVHNLFVIEDAAQAIESFYKMRPLGSIGNLATFSFHETKNINSGEGGLLCINDESFKSRSEIIREKGTNRSSFFRGEIDKYGWVDIGSSFLPSDIIAAYLYAQLENLDRIQKKRKEIWDYYYNILKSLENEECIKLPKIPPYATNSAHMFYFICRSLEERTHLIDHLRSYGVLAVFHYLSLHKSPYFTSKHDGRELPFADHYSNCLLRLPMYYELSQEDQDFVLNLIIDFYSKKRTATKIGTKELVYDKYKK